MRDKSYYCNSSVFLQQRPDFYFYDDGLGTQSSCQILLCAKYKYLNSDSHSIVWYTLNIANCFLNQIKLHFMKHAILAWTILLWKMIKSLDSISPLYPLSTINKHSEHLNFPEVLKIVQRIFCELMLWKLYYIYYILFRYLVSTLLNLKSPLKIITHRKSIKCGEGLIFGCLQSDTFSLFCTIFFLLL